MVTIKEIAKRLDLDVSTVSRALADHPRISRSTKELVRRTADRLGYVAHSAARIMRGGTSNLIGLLVPDIRSEFYSSVAQSLSECFERHGFHLTLSITDDDEQTELKQMRELMGAHVAGVVIVPSAAPKKETLQLLQSVHHAQLLRRHPTLHDWFGMDDKVAICRAVEHLFSLGHRRIGFVGDTLYSTGRDRLSGFHSAHKQARIRLSQGLIKLGKPTSRFAAQALDELLDLHAPPTAVITSTVPGTVGVAERLFELGIQIPDRLSFVGFGDALWARFWGPGLTTIDLPTPELGARCGKWLVHRLKPQEFRTDDSGMTCPTKLIVRGSTGQISAAARIHAVSR